ncbi:MAG: transcriptional regulator [Rhodobacteraceae bacterium]|nr:transcriptional regulator [Paracoccaceae bacterium]
MLSDRLTHDPHLAASVHELLSTAAAIRSTAQILAEPGELEREWRDRFHRNLNEDSLRLAESCKALVDYLDESGAAEEKRGVPQEEMEAFVAASGYHYPQLETSGTAVDALVQESAELTTGAARQITAEMLGRYAADARRMPLPRMREALERFGFAPLALAEVFGTDLAAVLRRLAAMPPGVLPDPVGLVTCDAAGSLLFRKPVDGFAVPRFGATCPLWPMFTALARPLTPLRRTLTQEGRSAAVFDAFSIAQPVGSRDFNQDPLFHATMLVRRIPGGRAEGTPEAVGSTCRVCPRSACQARREPSILSEGF